LFPLNFSFLTISKLEKSFVLYPRNTIPFDVSFLSIIASPELLKIIFSEINFKFFLFFIKSAHINGFQEISFLKKIFVFKIST